MSYVIHRQNEQKWQSVSQNWPPLNCREFTKIEKKGTSQTVFFHAFRTFLSSYSSSNPSFVRFFSNRILLSFLRPSRSTSFSFASSFSEKARTKSMRRFPSLKNSVSRFSSSSWKATRRSFFFFFEWWFMRNKAFWGGEQKTSHIHRGTWEKYGINFKCSPELLVLLENCSFWHANIVHKAKIPLFIGWQTWINCSVCLYESRQTEKNWKLQQHCVR